MKEMTSAVTRAQREARSASEGATPITVCAARIGPANIIDYLKIIKQVIFTLGLNDRWGR